MNQTKTIRKSSNGSHTASIQCRRKKTSTPSTISYTWVAVCLLILPQPNSYVGAFAPSQKSHQTLGAQTTIVKNVSRSPLTAPLNDGNVENQPTLKERFLDFKSEITLARNTPSGWSTIIRGRMNNDRTLLSEANQQFVVDKYLESIDRRYKRVHQMDTREGQRGFTSALSWLTAKKTSLKEEQIQRSADDALHVLGLADLASARLLQKHQLSVTQANGLSNKVNDSITIDVQQEKDTTTSPFIQVSLAAKRFARFSLRMYNAYNYRYTVVSLKLRARFYQTLRFVGSTSTHFLASL